MKTYIPLDRLKRSRDSGSALYNMHPTDVLGRAGGGNLTDCVGFCAFLGSHRSHSLIFFVGGKSHGLCGGCIADYGEICQRHVPTL